MDKKFIMTTNMESAALLGKMGLQQVYSDDKHWIFINDGKLVFEKISNVTYTDKLCI